MAAKIKIWGRRDSSNVQKVLWCCGELGIAFDRIDIGGKFGGNKEKPYLDRNPNGLVPTIEDGSFVLWESNSIMRYLVDKYGPGKLLPSTPEGRADANRWMDWQLSTFNPAIVPLFWGLIRYPEEKRDKAAIEASLQKTIKAWEIVDDQLAEASYLAGNEFSIGDIPLGVWVYRWYNLPISRPDFKNLKGWYERLCRREPYKTHIMIPVT
ncbi:MAG: glutathione S-transferase [Deltaproteobacteria bacterium]|nr:glutathione S-transferase [Deltaproteobacteria bacterium]MBI2540535.1 glutathione S-transferase [Deltaproteobacteria bacterium]MBI3062338.1 glutathione S-transferase [Deltaproteobacteria bacterium]